MSMIKSIKQYLKNTFVFSAYTFIRCSLLYRVSYTYGWCCKPYLVNRLYRKTFFAAKGTATAGEGREKRFIFIGDKNENSTMKVAVFGDIVEHAEANSRCQFYTTHKLSGGV